MEQQAGAWIIQGDPTEGVLITLAYRAKLIPPGLNREMPRADGHIVAMTGDGVNDTPALKKPTWVLQWIKKAPKSR